MANGAMLYQQISWVHLHESIIFFKQNWQKFFSTNAISVAAFNKKKKNIAMPKQEKLVCESWSCAVHY